MQLQEPCAALSQFGAEPLLLPYSDTGLSGFVIEMVADAEAAKKIQKAVATFRLVWRKFVLMRTLMFMQIYPLFLYDLRFDVIL